MFCNVVELGVTAYHIHQELCFDSCLPNGHVQCLHQPTNLEIHFAEKFTTCTLEAQRAYKLHNDNVADARIPDCHKKTGLYRPKQCYPMGRLLLRKHSNIV